MKIKEITAFPIRITRDDDDEGNERPAVIDYGEYFVDKTAFTSIYSKHHETTVIKIETDTGIIGWGEAQSPVSPRTTHTIIEDLVRPLIMGRDPFDIEAIWTRNYGAMRERGHPTGFYIDAIGGTDIALWDIVGKATGKPVHKLAGGRYRDKIKLYAGISGTDPEKVADKAEEHVGYGYQALKLHLLLDAEGVAEIASTVRKRIGPSIMLMCDVHMRQSVSSAIKLGRELEKLDFTWLESPLVPEDIPGAVALSEALDMAVAIGEWSRTRYEMREAFERRAYDIVMHDIARTGITEGHRIGTIADTYNIPVAPHVGGGGILSVASTVEYSASCSNFMIMEHSHHANRYKNAITAQEYGPKNGFFEPSDKPGLGIEIDQSLVEKHLVS
ncbi:MAG TPA: mandelate racemase/muconate lactonizing enzyme family protein [Dehalococcoidia bacterium]|nr:mandelate racemase/muconate lactonizing enzyme family protein [Dehalococcoidia bacterium]HIK90355.1 mandelate racemase/muconate lactonizing enzyme family protein [Dehalococcoidia bacterium]